jgi:hypothetical protein
VSGLALAGLGACASPAKIQEAAYRDDVRAQQLEAQGDYAGAANKRADAARQRAKAAERSTWYY